MSKQSSNQGIIVGKGGQMNSGPTAVGPNSRATQTTYDQKYQQVETQYNIAGDYNPGVAQDREGAVAELRKLIKEIARAQAEGTLGADLATDADYQVKKAILQAEKPDADGATIVDHLKTAGAVIASASAATELATAVVDAVQMAEKIFS